MFDRNRLAKKLNMIPKYLLKEVLFYKEKYKDQTEITRLVPNKNYIEYTSEVTGNPYNYITHDKINIYELANKCKDYCCFSFGIKLYSEVRKRDSRCCISKNRDGEMINKQIIGKTEPEAIFKAAEWVLNNKGIK